MDKKLTVKRIVLHPFNFSVKKSASKINDFGGGSSHDKEKMYE